MTHLTQIWGLTIERGPDCLFARLHAATTSPSEDGPLADTLWHTLERHFVYRLVIELDQVETLSDHLLGELIALSHRLRQRGGMLRLCGLSPTNRVLLKAAQADGRLPSYPTRREAMAGAHAKG
jgi:anti-anti-sigma regulatory factor